MKNRNSAVHPELQPFAGMIPKMSFNQKSLRRWRFLSQFQRLWRKPRDVRIDNLFIAGMEEKQQIRLRLYRPKGIQSPMPLLLWLHGGGFVMGKPEQDDHTCIQYVREAGVIVASVDYRYAPEYPFPAALDDCYHALKWLVAHAEQIQLDPTRIAVGGASAGGGLAAALAQLSTDEGEIPPVFQLLVYPMLDDRSALREDIANSEGLTWTLENNRFGWESYLWNEPGLDELPEYAAPARRADLNGLPPAWIGVGTLDLFHDEDVAYGQRLQESGVECEIYVVPGAFHGFDVVGGKTQVVRDFRAAQIAALAHWVRGKLVQDI